MKIHNVLNGALRHKGKLKVLRFLLFGREENTGRGIAKGVAMSASATHAILKDLKSEGLIMVRKMGNALLYKLNKDVYVMKEILIPLFEKEKNVYEKLITLVKCSVEKQRDNIASVVLFGSVVRQEETTESDIDILIITHNKKGKRGVDSAMDELCVKIAKEFDTAVSPYILTEKELKDVNPQKKRLINSILENNRLIYGEPIERILA